MNQNKIKKYQKKRQRKPTKWLPILLAMGGLVFAGLSFLAFQDGSVAGLADDGGGTPILKVDKEKVDLGDVKLNQPVEVSFRISNEGDGTLKLLEEPYVEVVKGC